MPKAILILLFAIACGLAWSQGTPTPSNASGQAGFSRAPQEMVREIDIVLKSFLPKPGFIVKIKKDTYVPAGKYPFTISKDAIRQESRKQLADWHKELNKWLEESK